MAKKKYILKEKMSVYLGPSPKASSKSVSTSMKGNVKSDTKPELLLRKALWHSGIRGYRKNWKGVPGTPDICFLGKKLAVFVNGCFWHRCPQCNLPLPKTNRDFWEKKFKRNQERDKKKIKRLEDNGWIVYVAWECEINKSVEHVVEEIKVVLKYVSSD